jgi:hypothetical protein
MDIQFDILIYHHLLYMYRQGRYIIGILSVVSSRRIFNSAKLAGNSSNLPMVHQATRPISVFIDIFIDTTGLGVQ